MQTKILLKKHKKVFLLDNLSTGHRKLINKKARFFKLYIHNKKKIQKLIKKYKIDKKNILGHSDVAPTRKKDPGEKFPWKYLAKFGIGKWHSLPQRNLIKNRGIKISLIDKKIF